MDLLLCEIDIVHREGEGFPDPYACPQKKENECPIPGIVDHTDQRLDILRGYRPGECVGKLDPYPPLQERQREDVLVHEEVDEGNDGDHAGPHCRDIETSVLFVLDEGLEVGPDDLRDVAFPQPSVEPKKEHDRGEGAFDGLWLVVRPPLVAQVTLEAVLRGEVDTGEPLKDMIDNRSLPCRFGGAAIRVGWYWFCLGHLFLLFGEKKQVR